jgi:hypothetical protein
MTIKIDLKRKVITPESSSLNGDAFLDIDGDIWIRSDRGWVIFSLREDENDVYVISNNFESCREITFISKIDLSIVAKEM